MPHVSEYDVEVKFLNRLESIGDGYVDLKNYDDVFANFRVQLVVFNAVKLTEVKGEASFRSMSPQNFCGISISLL